VGLLAYGSLRPRITFPQPFLKESSAMAYINSEASPITAAALQRICTVFPYSLSFYRKGKKPVVIN